MICKLATDWKVEMLDQRWCRIWCNFLFNSWAKNFCSPNVPRDHPFAFIKQGSHFVWCTLDSCNLHLAGWIQNCMQKFGRPLSPTPGCIFIFALNKDAGFGWHVTEGSGDWAWGVRIAVTLWRAAAHPNLYCLIREGSAVYSNLHDEQKQWSE